MRAIVATFIILFATGVAAQPQVQRYRTVAQEIGHAAAQPQVQRYRTVGLATIAGVGVHISVTDDDECRIRVDGLQDEAELGLRRSGIQVSNNDAILYFTIVAMNSRGCVAAYESSLQITVYFSSGQSLLWIPVLDPSFAVSTFQSETSMNRMLRDKVRDDVVSVSNAILDAREELPQCANAVNAIGETIERLLFIQSFIWEKCVEELR